MLNLLGASSWKSQRSNCRVLCGDKMLNVLARLFRNVGEELGDPYVLFHMVRLSRLFRSHPNQCVSLELAVLDACRELSL